MSHNLQSRLTSADSFLCWGDSTERIANTFLATFVSVDSGVPALKQALAYVTAPINVSKSPEK